MAGTVNVSERQELDKPKSIHRRYFLASDTLTAAQAGAAARAHWAVENGLHWRLDVLFGEDASRVRIEHAPENVSLLRTVALNAIKADPSKGSVKVKRFQAAMNTDFLLTPQRRRGSATHQEEGSSKITEATLTVAFRCDGPTNPTRSRCVGLPAASLSSAA